jgi:acetyl-CoA carboxylase biotin carboxyl carrier protein
VCIAKITIKTTTEGTESTTTYVQQMPMQAAPQMAAPQVVAAPVVSDAIAAPASDDNAKYISKATRVVKEKLPNIDWKTIRVL